MLKTILVYTREQMVIKVLWLTTALSSVFMLQAPEKYSHAKASYGLHATGT